jgi:hypothetical protein
MILFLPLLALGLAYFASRAQARPEMQLPPAAVGALGPAAPSPLVVLDAFMRLGETPPPPVILCAIAQAELLGRGDVVEAIVRAFVLPVVQAAQQSSMMPTMPMMLPPTEPPMMPQPPGDDAWVRSMMPPGGPGGPPMTPVTTGPMRSMVPTPTAPDLGSPRPRPPGPRPIARAEDARVEVLSRAEPAAQSSAGTITVSGRSCPIDGVGAREWEEFAARVAREQPTFSSPRHVGQFRQRRDRLAELGIDPASVVESPQAQADAFVRDMGDAHHHAQESGLVAEYRGVTMEIPRPDGQHVPIEVTLSGVLGVIQAAGLEGAAEWLEKPGDRVRYPGTTAAFVRTNGVF